MTAAPHQRSRHARADGAADRSHGQGARLGSGSEACCAKRVRIRMPGSDPIPNGQVAQCGSKFAAGYRSRRPRGMGNGPARTGPGRPGNGSGAQAAAWPAPRHGETTGAHRSTAASAPKSCRAGYRGRRSGAVADGQSRVCSAGRSADGSTLAGDLQLPTACHRTAHLMAAPRVEAPTVGGQSPASCWQGRTVSRGSEVNKRKSCCDRPPALAARRASAGLPAKTVATQNPAALHRRPHAVRQRFRICW